jgi:hypothetical protein
MGVAMVISIVLAALAFATLTRRDPTSSPSPEREPAAVG